jgi:hypothetical protein
VAESLDGVFSAAANDKANVAERQTARVFGNIDHPHFDLIIKAGLRG